MSTKLNYELGSIFVVPLREKGFAIGLVSRMAPTGKVLFGHFFNFKFETAPEHKNAIEIIEKNDSYVLMFGDLNLINGSWNVLGKLDDFDISNWPLPTICRVDELLGLCWEIEKDETNPERTLSEKRISELPKNYITDSLYGAGAVELFLTDKLRG